MGPCAGAGLVKALCCVLDGLVDVLRVHVEFLGDALLGLQLSLLDGCLDRALADDDEAAWPASMRSPNSLTSDRDIPRHRCPLTPPTAAPTAEETRIEGAASITPARARAGAEDCPLARMPTPIR